MVQSFWRIFPALLLFFFIPLIRGQSSWELKLTTPKRLRALLISHKGEVVYENYFQGAKSGELFNIKSVSKSILSLLVGVALEEDKFHALEDPLSKYLPKEFKSLSPQKKKITLKDLLTMSSGLESVSMENYGKWVSSKDWVRYALKMKTLQEPGQKFSYSTGDSHLLAVALEQSVEGTIKDFLFEKLLNPLGISKIQWDQDPQGHYFGGNNMFMSAKDLLKIGMLVLNHGKWKTDQIVPKDWIKKSTSSHITPQGVETPFETVGYGFWWWKFKLAGELVVGAWGHGGQFVLIFPDLQAVIILLSREGPDNLAYYQEVERFLQEQVIPKLLKK